MALARGDIERVKGLFEGAMLRLRYFEKGARVQRKKMAEFIVAVVERGCESLK